MAAARKVSAAPSTTVLSWATSTRASLPTEVVLPEPLTPTTSTTPGLPSAPVTAIRRSMEGSTSASSSSRRIVEALASSAPSTRRRVRSLSTSSWVGATPTSAVIRVSSISSQVSSSSRSRESSLSSPRPRPPCERASRCRRRTSRLAVPSGRSSVVTGAWGSSGTSGASTGGSSVIVPVGAAGGTCGGGCLRPLTKATSPTTRPITTMAITRMTKTVMRRSNQTPVGRGSAVGVHLCTRCDGDVLARGGLGVQRRQRRRRRAASPHRAGA